MIVSAPKLTIITVCYNALELLKGTAASVERQKSTEVEYLVIDGKSSDGTQEFLKSSTVVDNYISEPDKGLYDAMNKGIQLAKGQMIWFLNAGDYLYEGDTMATILKCIQEDTDVVYGEVMLVNDNREEQGTRSDLSTQKLPDSLSWKSMRFGMVVCHQGFIVRRSICPPYDDKTFGLTADIDWVINCLKSATTIVNTKIILAEYLQGGLSKQHFKRSMKSRFKVLETHFGFLSTGFAHIWILFRAAMFKLKRLGKSSY